MHRKDDRTKSPFEALKEMMAAAGALFAHLEANPGQPGLVRPVLDAAQRDLNIRVNGR